MADSRSRLAIILEAAGLVHSGAATHYGLTPSTEYYKSSYDGPSGLSHTGGTDAYTYGSETFYIDSKKSKYAGYYKSAGVLTEGSEKRPTVTSQSSHVGKGGAQRRHEEYEDRHGTIEGAGATLDKAAEKRLLRKLDTRVMPILSILLFLATLDRSNIITARTLGMEDDIGLDDSQFSIAQMTFFLPQILFAIPLNLIFCRMNPSTWFAGMTLMWGVVTIGQGFVQSSAQLIACRFLTGLFEAGLLPGAVLLIATYYPRYELLKRLAWFFSAAIAADAFGGLFSNALDNLDGHQDIKGWRWIFIIEGTITAAVAIMSKFLIANWPERARFLSDADKTLLAARHTADTNEAAMSRLDGRALFRIFTDWKIYCGALMYLGVANAGYAISLFSPAVFSDLGYTGSDANIHALPTYAVAFVVTLLFAYISDRVQKRFVFALLGLIIAFIGYILLVVQDRIDNGSVKYLSVFFAVTGSLAIQPVILSWMMNCTIRRYKHSVVAAMQIGLGAIGGVASAFSFSKGDGPDFKAGYGMALGLLGLSALACCVLYIGNKIENARRQRGGRDDRLQMEDADNLGDDHPHFKLTT